MTQEDKELLLKDLCTRLPYGVKIQVKDWAALDTELKIGHIQRLQNDDIELKPYLRPMLIMTEEELDKYRTLKWTKLEHEVVDWLNARHFDYRGLIEKNLALDCTGLHIYD